jgi:hypothetical protein
MRNNDSARRIAGFVAFGNISEDFGINPKLFFVERLNLTLAVIWVFNGHSTHYQCKD